MGNGRVNMRISYDPNYDILYIKFGEAEKVLCKDIDEVITMDIDVKGSRLRSSFCI